MSTLFSTSAVPPQDRFGYWHDAICRSYVRTSLVSDQAERFQGELLSKSLDVLSVSDITGAPMLAQRSDGDVRTSTPDVVFLQVLMEGSSVVVQDDREAVMGAGEMCLLDPRRPYLVKTSQARHVVLNLPRSRLQDLVGDVMPLTARAISAASGDGALAARFMRTLMDTTEPDDASAVARLASQAIDLAALAVTHDAPETIKRLSSPASVSRLRLHHAIEACTTTPGVRCDDVAGMAGISARYANILLSQEGISLERLIIRRRLELCSAQLADPLHKHRSIGDIARDFGFVSAAHFARCFKQAFGMTARDFRGDAGRHGA